MASVPPGQMPGPPPGQWQAPPPGQWPGPQGAALAGPPRAAWGPPGKPRSSLAVIVFGIITLGIYSLVWTYKTFKEMKDYSREGIGGGAGLIITIIFGIVTIFLMPAEVGNLYERDGQPKPVSGVTGFWVILPLVGSIVWLVKTQGALSRFWRAHGAQD